MSSTDISLNPRTIQFIRRILSVAETGKPEWDPGQVFTHADGKAGRRQVTLSIGFTEDGGNLRVVLERYLAKGGALSAKLAPYVTRLGCGVLASNAEFKRLLREAGKEPAMAQAQEEVFNEKYLAPALKWARENGLVLPLSVLVIADSFLHSGSVPVFLTKRFPEKRPANGGEERAWTNAYLSTRRKWLATHSNKLLRVTVYRADCFLREIGRGNWELTQSPVVMHGTQVRIA